MIGLTFMLALAQEDAVLEAAKSLQSAKNYSFKGETLTELPDMGGGGGEAPEPQKFEGKHDTDIGTTILTPTQEIVRYKGRTASRPRAEWRVQPEEGDEGGRRGGGRRGGMMGRFGGGAARAPHEDLADLGDKIKSVKGGEKKETVGEDECTLYEAEMTEEAAMAAFGGGGRMGRMMEGAEFDGDLKVWIDGHGRIAKYEARISVFASTEQGDFEMSATRTVMLYAFDETKVEIPDGAKDAIEGGDF